MPVSDQFDAIPAFVMLDAIMQSFLLGIIFGQAYTYHHDYRDDSKMKRVFVFAIVVLATWVIFFPGVLTRFDIEGGDSMQAALEDLKVWRIAIHHKHWVSFSFIFLSMQLSSRVSSLAAS